MATTEQTPQLPSETKLAVPQCALCGDTGIVLYDDQHGEPRNAQCTCKVAPSPANAEAGDVELDEVIAWLEWEGPRGNETVQRLSRSARIALRSLASVRAERDALVHDLVRHINIGSSQAEEIAALARENERLRAEMTKARNELAGVGPNSSKEFHGMGICSALSILDAALAPVSP